MVPKSDLLLEKMKKIPFAATFLVIFILFFRFSLLIILELLPMTYIHSGGSF